MIKIIKESIGQRYAISDEDLKALSDKYGFNDEHFEEFKMITGIKDIPNLSPEENRILTFLAKEGYLFDPFITTNIDAWDGAMEAISFGYDAEGVSIVRSEDGKGLCTPFIYGWPDMRLMTRQWYITKGRIYIDEILPKPRRNEFSSNDEYSMAIEEWNENNISTSNMEEVINFLMETNII